MSVMYAKKNFELETEAEIEQHRQRGEKALWMSDDGENFTTPPEDMLALHVNTRTLRATVVSFYFDSPGFPVYFQLKNKEEAEILRRAFINGQIKKGELCQKLKMR